MRRRMSWLLVGLLLASFLVVSVPAAAQEPVTLEVYDPSGAFEVSEVHAPRLDTLAGKTICELSNGSWEHDRTFALIRDLLQRQFPDVKFVTFDELGLWGTDRIDYPNLDQIEAIAKEKGCDALISGNAG